MRKLKNKSYSKIYKNLTLKLSFILMICVFTITIGYSSMTSTLSINGSAKFVPVGMIRVMSIERNSLVNASEIDAGYTSDTINVLIDLNDASATATYDVNITNLGQVDKQLTNILNNVFSNEDVEYVLNGLEIDDVIVAGESRDFTITFKYKNGVTPQTSRINAQLQFVFEDYQDSSTFPIVFRQEGACTFHGTEGTITGDDCSRFLNKYYINTEVDLYSTANWQKDYEIGFTIEDYVPSQQVKQAVFVNSKYEKESLKWPGLVFRRAEQNNNIEITQSINNGSKASATISGYTLPLSVRIFRINGIIFYSLNGGQLIQLQNMTNFNQQFDVPVTFGAALDENGGAMRNIKATMSNMYVRLGTYIPEQYTIRFNANGGTVSEPTRTVPQFSTLGTLPTPTYNEDWSFAGWYTDLTFTTRADPNAVVMADAEYFAKWVLTKNIEVNGSYYNTIADAITASGSSQTTILLHDDVDEIISIPSGKNIIIDLQNHTITNPESNAIITNNGTLKVMNGTLRNSSTFAVIDNLSTGVLTIEDATLLGTNTKQAVYNNGGILTITGNSYLSTTSSIRAAVQNLNNGTVTITGGTIISTNHAGINNERGTLIIGTSGGGIDTTNPVIIGKTYGVTSSVNYTFYDGIIKGKTNAVNDKNKITTFEDNSEKTDGTEVIDGVTYKTLYLTAVSNEPENGD